MSIILLAYFWVLILIPLINLSVLIAKFMVYDHCSLVPLEVRDDDDSRNFLIQDCFSYLTFWFSIWRLEFVLSRPVNNCVEFWWNCIKSLDCLRYMAIFTRLSLWIYDRGDFPMLWYLPQFLSDFFRPTIKSFPQYWSFFPGHALLIILNIVITCLVIFFPQNYKLPQDTSSSGWQTMDILPIFKLIKWLDRS